MANADNKLSDRESEYSGRKNVDGECEYDSKDEFDNNPTCKMNNKILLHCGKFYFFVQVNCFKYILKHEAVSLEEAKTDSLHALS